MKKLLFIACMMAFDSFAQVPNWQWAKSAKGTGHDYGQSISTDGKGNCYSTGYFQTPSVIFDKDTLTGSIIYHDNIFVVKYNASGSVIWAKTAGGANNAYGYGIETDADGNSYVAGHFQGSGVITFDNITLNAPNNNNAAFLLKYDSSGTVLWAKIIGEAGSSTINFGVDLDANGNSYITGTFSDSTVVIKYDNSGNPVWRKYAVGDHRSWSISTDSAGNSYVTGYFRNSSLTFDNITVPNTSNGWIIFVSKYDNAGKIVWAKSTGTYASLYKPSISIDENGNSYVTGFFNGNYAGFGSTVLTNAGSDDVFIVKFNNQGNIVWAKRAGGPDFDNGTGISTDRKGCSYITGFFRDWALFDNITLFSSGVTDIFVAKYDSSGNVLWANKAGGINPDWGNDICFDAIGNSYVTGYFFSPYASFDNITLTNCDTINNPAEIFVAKMGSGISGMNFNNNLNDIFSAFPSPSSGIFTIQLSNLLWIEGNVEIYNLIGKLIYSATIFSSNPFLLNISSEPEGVYFIRLKTKTGITVRKIIIAR